MIRTPLMWSRRTFLGAILLPFSALYFAFVTLHVWLSSPYRAKCPVICIGNITLGGGGKTPVAIALGEALIASGKKVAFVSKGYKGSLIGPVQVATDVHTAREVGDEPMLLARVAPTYIATSRVDGIKAAELSGVDVIIMDDGAQNPTVYKDKIIYVIDGLTGLGNGWLFPSGPLRQMASSAFNVASAVLVVGEDKANVSADIPQSLLYQVPVHTCFSSELEGQKLLAFAAIAYPEKFFNSLSSHSCEIVRTISFPDHHYFSDKEFNELVTEAKRLGAMLITTEKDWVRLQGAHDCEAVYTLPMSITLPESLIDSLALASLTSTS